MKPLLLLAALALPVAATPVINEIMYRPGASYPEDTGLEFIELHNPGDTPADLSGWAISSGVRYTFPENTSIPAGGYLVIAADLDKLTTSTSLSGILGPWDGRLSNSGETVTLSDSSGTTIDTIRYADEGDWAVRTRDSLGGWSWITQANGGNCSLERRNPYLSINSGQNWGSSATPGGTPGAANTLLAADIAPVISEVRHSPAVPKSTDPVTISCRLTDESAAQSLSATLWWRDATSTTPGAYSSLAMTHDGGGLFLATLPPKAALTIVEFYISATDGALTRTWPAPTSEGQNANCAYQVDDAADSTAAPAYRLILTAAENAAFTTVNAQSDRRFAATLIATHGDDAVIRYRSAIRIRGNSSRNYTIRPLRVSFPTDTPWNGVSSFMIGPRGAPVQYLAHKIQRAAGLVAADVTPIELRRQGVKASVTTGSTADYGLLCRIEDFDGDYADNHFPTAVSTQIYRKVSITQWSANYSIPSTPDGTYSGWDKQNSKALNDWSDVVAFTQTWQALAAPHFTGATAGNAASGTWRGTAFTDAEMETLSTIVDLDYLARWLAVMVIMPNWEPNLSTGEDDDYAAAFVNDGVHTRMFPLPHDMDTTFGTGETTFAYNVGNLYTITQGTGGGGGMGGGGGNRTMPLFLPLLGNATTPGNAVFREKYLTAIRQLFGSVFDADTSATSNPPFHQFVDNHLGAWLPAANRTTLKTFMTNRQAYLLGLVGAGKITPSTPTAAATHTSPPAGSLRLNEILASNVAAHPVSGAYPDLVELHNTGATAINLAGYRLDDSSNTYTIPAGASIAPGEYLLFTSDTLGFGLSSGGDSLHLYNPSGNLLDEVTFGPQIDDLTLSRSPADPDTWALATPTLGAANAAPLNLASPSLLHINEWAGNPDFRLSGDFVELHNPSSSPAPLGGLRLTDDLLSYPGRHAFPNLSFIPAGAFLVLDSDALGFGIDAQSEFLWLTGANAAVIHQVNHSSPFADQSTGLTPDGGTAWTTFAIPTPGLSNTASSAAHAPLLAWLRITEIMYAATGGNNYDYIELQNTSDTLTLDLSGVRFTNGIDYTFPGGLTLAPGAFIVVAKNRDSYLARYTSPEALAPGVYSGNLANEGERVALTLPAPWDINILNFRYESTWQPTATGGGHSLATRSTTATLPRDWGQSTTWSASAALYGSPGAEEPPVITSSLAATGVHGSAFSYLIAATKNPTTFTADNLPGGLTLSSSTGLISGTPAVSGIFEIPISASNASATASATLTLTLTIASHGPLDHFVWDWTPATAWASHQFAIRLTARDASGRIVENYESSTSLSAFLPGDSSSTPVLITEFTDEGEDQFELQNVTADTAHTAGWTVVIGDSTTDVNSRNAVTFALPDTLTAGSLLRVSESNSTGRVYFGGSIAWTQNNSRGWIMLLDATGALRDFVAFGWTAAQLQTLSLAIGDTVISPVASGHWSGAGLAAGTRGNVNQTTDSWRRTGSADQNSAAGWLWSQNAASFGAVNSGLTLPWIVTIPLTLTPSTVTFSGGQFIGELAIAEPGSAATLTATGSSGQSGNSTPLDILDSTDTDNDGLPDAWEAAHGLSSTDPADALLDSDGDGQSNLAEFHAGTDPRNSASVFAVLESGLTDTSTYRITWSVTAGKLYRLRRSEDLLEWTDLFHLLATETAELSYDLPTDDLPHAFFRIETGD